MKKDDATLGFEGAMARLEAIVSALEEGKVSLEESLKMYEEGVELLRQCTRHIQEGRARVEVLTRQGEEMLPVPYESEDDDGI